MKNLYNKLSKECPGLDFSHIRSKKKFKEYCDKLGKRTEQINQKYNCLRMDIFMPYIEDPLIELGCHNGLNFIKFVKNGCVDITGVDCSSTLILEAMKKYGSSEKITLIESFIEDLSIVKKYKTVVLTETLEHVINVNPVLKKAKALLNKDGCLLISVPSIRNGQEGHLRGINKESMEELLRKNNLRVFKWLFPRYSDSTSLIAKHEKK